MIVYCSMFLYVFFVGVLSKTYMANQIYYDKYKNKTTLFFAIAILAMPVFFIGMRTSYIDTEAYIREFQQLPVAWSELDIFNVEKGKGWVVYEWIIKKFISDNPSMFLLITAIIQAGAILRLYYKYSNDYSYSVLLFFLSCAFLNMMNGIRQFLAVATILYFVDCIFEKKYLKFIIFALVACSIHISAIVWIPAIFIVQGKTWNIRTITFSGLILLAIMYVEQFTDLLEGALIETAYSGYTNQFLGDDGSNIVHTLIAIIPVAIAFVGKNIVTTVDDKRANILINIATLGVMTSLLANFTSGILIGRMPIYFTIFNYALLPWLFENVFNLKSMRIIKVACFLGYGLYAIYYMHSLGTSYVSDLLHIYL